MFPTIIFEQFSLWIYFYCICYGNLTRRLYIVNSGRNNKFLVMCFEYMLTSTLKFKKR